MGVAPQAPKALGQFRQAQPFSCFSFCQALARARKSLSDSSRSCSAGEGRRVLFEKAPRLLAKAGFFRGICKIHSGSPV